MHHHHHHHHHHDERPKMEKNSPKKWKKIPQKDLDPKKRNLKITHTWKGTNHLPNLHDFGFVRGVILGKFPGLALHHQIPSKISTVIDPGAESRFSIHRSSMDLVHGRCQLVPSNIFSCCWWLGGIGSLDLMDVIFSPEKVTWKWIGKIAAWSPEVLRRTAHWQFFWAACRCCRFTNLLFFATGYRMTSTP